MDNGELEALKQFLKEVIAEVHHLGEIVSEQTDLEKLKYMAGVRIELLERRLIYAESVFGDEQ